MMKCRLACLSTRNSILPPLMSVTALATSGVTVPVFGFGIRPRGPSTRPRRPTLPIRSGVATAASKSRQPPWTLLDQLVASRRRRRRPRGPPRPRRRSAKTRTRAVLPVPCGRMTVPRTIWSALRGSTPSRSATSTVASNLVGRGLLGEPDGLERGVEPVRRRSSRRRRGRPCCASWLLLLECVESWSCGPKRALPRYGAVVLAGRANVGQSSTVMPIDRAVPAMIFAAASRSLALRSGILVCAISRTWSLVSLPTLVLCGSPLPLATPAAFLISSAAGGVFGDEGERAVLVDRDLDRDDVAALGLRRGVVRLAELHDVDAVLTEGGTDRRGRGGLRRRCICSLMMRGDLLLGWHSRSSVPSVRWSRLATCGQRPGWNLPSRWAHPLVPERSDLGDLVERELDRGLPAEDGHQHLELLRLGVDLVDRWPAASRTGPSMTVTDSPTSKSTVAATFAASAWPSACSSGSGASSRGDLVEVQRRRLVAVPTKPVTPGVLRTAAHDSSVRSIRTRM